MVARPKTVKEAVVEEADTAVETQQAEEVPAQQPLQVTPQQLQNLLNITVERFAQKSRQYENEIAQLTAQILVANDNVGILLNVLKENGIELG